jgi:hypothetical protein
VGAEDRAVSVLVGAFWSWRTGTALGRTAVVPVLLSGVDYRRAQEACHKPALMWNELVAAQRKHWQTQRPTRPGDLYAAT